MSDLRERLAKIEALGEFDAWSRTDEILDAAIAVVAEWLHEEAEQLRQMPEDIDQTGRTVRLVKADAVLALADSLTRKEPTP